MSKIIINNNFKSRIEKVQKEELTRGAKTFIDSIHSYCIKHNGLTEGQLKYFEKLESAFTEEAKAMRLEWAVRFDAEKRKKLRIACMYYRTTGAYFADTYRAYFADTENFLPSEKQYKAITENKWIQKLFNELEREPLFAIGKLVRFRTSSRVPRHMRNQIALVVAHNSDPITSLAKGAKKYTVLPFGTDTTVIMEERDLKKIAKNK